MSRKLIAGDFTATHELKVYRDSEWQEYIAIIRCKETGRIVSDYHSDDKDDAISTGRSELRQSSGTPPAWKLIDVATGKEVTLPAKRVDFRGDMLTVTDGQPPRHPASTGRVDTNQGSFFPGAVDLQWVQP